MIMMKINFNSNKERIICQILTFSQEYLMAVMI